VLKSCHGLEVGYRLRRSCRSGCCLGHAEILAQAQPPRPDTKSRNSSCLCRSIGAKR
jgi:hypothetical protein